MAFGITSAIRRAAAQKVKSGSPLVTGFGVTMAKFLGYRKFLGEAWEDAVEETANEILEDARTRVPVETGKLRDSGYIRKSGSGVDVEFVIGFTVPYASYVHAQTEMKLKGLPRRGNRTGKYWDPQGQAEALFLSRAVEAHKGKVKARVVNTLKR